MSAGSSAPSWRGGDASTTVAGATASSTSASAGWTRNGPRLSGTLSLAQRGHAGVNLPHRRHW
eukprot:2533465-Prorocentrum_lima.AAC.1